jgi:SAM-dependent methyltransferase
MLHQFKVVRRLVSELHLRPFADEVNRALRTYNPGVMSRNARLRQQQAPSDPPFPPLKLVYKVTHTGDLGWFLESGERTARSIRESMGHVGRPLESLSSVLDFGCGCGRVLRQWGDVNGPRFYGTDYNPELSGWVQQNLKYVTVAKNGLEPPMTFGDAMFDLVYCISIFTHWTEPLQSAWMAEMQRVLRPNGVLLMTTCGEYYVPTLFDGERADFEAGKLVVRDKNLPGTNLCLAFHPESYVRSLAAKHGMEVLLFQPKGALGSPYQDQWLLRKI